MTTVYTDYLNAVSNYYSNIQIEGIPTINLDDVYFNVKLVVDDYEPNENHKPEDVERYILNIDGVIVGDDITKLSMSEIVDKAKESLSKGLIEDRDDIFKTIDELIDEDKREKVKQILSQPEINWNELSENGIKYFVFGAPDLNILTFCETII